MPQETVFRNIIGFLGELGIYDVVLPFLLVFTIVYAVFERTKVLGVDKIDGKNVPKHNLNSIASFVIAFLVIASSRLVAIINQAMANIVVLLMLSISFLLLIGTFYREGEDVFLQGGWRTFFMIFMAIGVFLIFLNAIPLGRGGTALGWILGVLRWNWRSAWVGTIIMIAFVVLFIWFITKEPSSKSSGGHGHSSPGHENKE